MPSRGGIAHRGAQQLHVIDQDVILLRQVDFKRLGANITDMLRNTHLRPGEKEGDQPWFIEGYVSVDQPRDMMVSKALLAATTGFGLARTDTGELLATFKRDEFERASKVQYRASAEVAVKLALEDTEEDGTDEEADDDA